MIRNWRKFCTLFLALVVTAVLAVVLLPQTQAYAEVYSGEWENISWSVDTETGVMTVSGTGSIPGVVNGGTIVGYDSIPWHFCRLDVKELRLEEGITGIPTVVFDLFTNLTDVYFASTVQDIPYGFAEGCDNLTRFTVHEDNQTFCDIDGVLFSKDKKKLVRCGHGFAGEYTIPETVTEIQAFAFYNCSKLTAVTIPNTVASIQSKTFFNCDSLAQVSIPDSVTKLGSHAFAGCDLLEQIRFSPNIKQIGAFAFQSLPKLTQLTLPQALTKIEGGAFGDCPNLQSIVIFNKLTQVDAQAFEGASAITDVHFVGTTEEFASFGGDWMFANANIQYGNSGIMGDEIQWTLDSLTKTLMITGSGSLTGKESFWSDYAGYFAKVYVQKGINGFTSCVDKKTFTSAGKETVEEVEYDTYAVSNRIIYNANGGVDVPLPQKVLHGRVATLTDKKPNRLGYVFLGWSLNKYATEPEFAPGAEYQPDGNVTFYAIWVKQDTVYLSVAATPKKTIYELGEKLDLTGLKIRLNNPDDTWEDVTDQCKVSGFDSQKPGQQTITVKYNDMTTSFRVSVLSREVRVVGMEPIVSRTVYQLGAAFDEESIVIKLKLSDGSFREVTDGYQVEGFSSEKLGKVKITMIYGEYKSTITLEIREKVEEGEENPQPTEPTDPTEPDPSVPQTQPPETQPEASQPTVQQPVVTPQKPASAIDPIVIFALVGLMVAAVGVVLMLIMGKKK